MMDNGWWMIDDEWWMINDVWWIMDDGCWVMDDGRWMMDNGWWMIDESIESTECTEAPLLWLKRKSWFSRRNMEKSTKS